jgi:hypothetical protein
VAEFEISYTTMGIFKVHAQLSPHNVGDFPTRCCLASIVNFFLASDSDARIGAALGAHVVN